MILEIEDKEYLGEFLDELYNQTTVYINLEKGKSKFKIYYDKINAQLVLRVEDDEQDSSTLKDERK